MELVRYAESECQAWFNANEMVSSTPQGHSIDEPQVLSLGNICMIDGSWTSTAQLSGYGWAWIDSLGKVQLMGTRNYGSTEMDDGEYASALDMLELQNGLQGFDRHD